MTDESRSGKADCKLCGNGIVLNCGYETPQNHQLCNDCASKVLDHIAPAFIEALRVVDDANYRGKSMANIDELRNKMSWENEAEVEVMNTFGLQKVH